jgi:hypothetical protein
MGQTPTPTENISLMKTTSYDFNISKKKLIYCYTLRSPMRKGHVLVAAVLIGSVLGLWMPSGNSIPVLASVERAALESIDLHLEECIRQFQAGYTKNALSHCEISEQELDALLENTTVVEQE